MPKKVPRNAPCPCGSGKKYKNCCIRKDFEWVENDDGTLARRIPVSDETIEILDSLRQAHVDKHGREPDLIFEGAPPFEVLEHWTVEAMKKAGIDPALIYAYENTNGLLLSARNESKVPDSDIAEWEAAIDRYERTTGQRAKKRRFDDDDIQDLMRHGPEDRAPANFVDRLPFPPPFSKEEWVGRPLSDVLNVSEYFAYFRKCAEEVTRSGRAEIYVKMFSVTALAGSSQDELDYERVLDEAIERQFTVAELKVALDAITQNCGPKGALPTAAAAFEFLSFIGEFIGSYADHIGARNQLSPSLTTIHGLALAAFVTAVNSELGIRDDFWTA